MKKKASNMKQVINSYITPGWPNVEVDYHIPIELFVDGFLNYDSHCNRSRLHPIHAKKR
jgi:hypothetical protein